jgi:dCMP deaminase
MVYDLETRQDPRISWNELYLNIALLLSKRSSCNRMSVGCVVTTTDNRRILSVGYNGNYAGGPNCCDTVDPGLCGCSHAETNSLIKMNYDDRVEKKLYTTHSPCVMCAKQIINEGSIKQVIYHNQYRLLDGINLLHNNNIEVIWIKDLQVKCSFL